MTRYFCDSCNAEREDAVCEKCGRETRIVEGSFVPPPAFE